MTENGVRLMDRNYIPSQNPLRIQLERVRERKEKREQEIKEFAERLAREEQARIAAYNEPLPEFPSKVPPDVQWHLLDYIAVVVRDAARELGKPSYLLPIHPERLSVALRIALLSTGMARSCFFIRLDDESIQQTDWFWHKVCSRLERNMLKYIPFFETLTKTGYIQFWEWLEPDFERLKKKGFLQVGEKKVIHLEIMKGKGV